MIHSRNPQPIGIAMLAIIFFGVAVWNGLRMGEAIFFWSTQEEYGVNFQYIGISGGFWLIVGILLAIGLLQGKTWGRKAALAGTLGYTSWYWFDRLILQRPHANWPFVLTVNILLLASIFIILFSRRTKGFFKRGL